MQDDTIPVGLCQCGCGARTGTTRGKPNRFLPRHHGRRRVRWVEEHRGYETPCWIWQLSLDSHGYGRVRVDGRERPAHRHLYEQHGGAVPDGMDLDHLCRVRECVNPEHLEPVTRAENLRRGGRTKLTAAEVRSIRIASATGARTSDLARQFGVHEATIWHIRVGSRWRDV